MFRILKNRFIQELWAPERGRARIALVFMAMRGLFALALPYYVGKTIAGVKDGVETEVIRHYVLMMILFATGTAFAQFWMRWLFIRSSRNFEERLRNRVFQHLSRLSFSYFNKVKTGDVMSRLTADVEAVRMGVGPGVMHMFQTGAMALGAVLFMLISNWQLALATLAPMGIMFLFIRRLMPLMHQASLRVQKQLATLSALSQESFSGSRVVKAFAREDYEVQRFEKQAKAYIDDSMSMAMTRGRMHVFIEVISGLVAVALLYFGGKGVIRGTFSLDHFIAFFGYFTMLVWPMIAMGWTLALFQRASVAMDRLESVLA
ncbi:MAG: ATP-binding cassette subfamily B multidrug efflux pump, partial [Planctomycetota bacterium]